MSTVRVSGDADGLTAVNTNYSSVTVAPYTSTPVVVTPSFPNTGFGPRTTTFMDRAFGIYNAHIH